MRLRSRHARSDLANGIFAVPQDYNPYGLYKPRVIFTIHNLNYGQKKIGEAAHACQKFTTVSPTYAYEVGYLLRCSWPLVSPKAFTVTRQTPALHVCSI